MIKMQLGEGKNKIIVEVRDENQVSAFEREGFKRLDK